MKPLPRKMRQPKKCRTITGRDSWYYVEPNGITVVGEADHNQLTTQARLTRRQLEAALEAIYEYNVP